jgi:putative ABC transport system permease protein
MGMQILSATLPSLTEKIEFLIIVGLILSYGIAELIDRAMMPASVSLPVILIAIFISFAVGIFSGLLPAMRASRLNPIEALQYDQ